MGSGRSASRRTLRPPASGVVAWMHTFSPAKMWISGLEVLRRPLLHLHTQFNRSIPWDVIDMDFMNLNQAAHGDREFGFIAARMRLKRTVVVGHWSDGDVQERIATWARAACARHDWGTGRIARIGDNMREVAVTDGDKVEAQRRLGFSVNGYGVGDLAAMVDDATDAEVDGLIATYLDEYEVAPELRPGGERADSLRDGARIEIGLRRFLVDGGFVGFTTTFEDLHGLSQLPGLAVQRLMRDGYGFGAEGDWKTAAMVRAMKVMSSGLPGGVSFMEDYTYHLSDDGDLVLGAHMLEVCESIAAGRPRLEVHPLSIGGKADPVRLVFDAQVGTRRRRLAHGHGPALQARHRPRRRRRPPSSPPAAPCRPSPLATATGPADQRGGMDRSRRLPSHEPGLPDQLRAPGRLRGDVRHRTPRDR